MSNNVKGNGGNAIWTTYEASLTPYGCARLIERNEPLITNLVKLFSYLLEKLFLLCNRKYGIHLFMNRELDEIHYIYRKAGESVVPSFYHARKNTKLREWFVGRKYLGLKDASDPPQVLNINEGDLEFLLRNIGFKEITNCACGSILPFDHGEMNLGKFIIWGERNLTRKNVPEHALLGWIVAWYSFLCKFLSREYRVNTATYLPSYYAVGWKHAAILFADIRNFTTMTEMLRNAYPYRKAKKYDPEPLRQIVNEYCAEMAKIIQEGNRGRIDKFLGDGIVAIFGEYDNHPSKIVCRALYVSSQMTKTFRKLKSRWQKMAFGSGYELEFNETVEIDLGIGIDFGTVLFDYLGDYIHRDYSVVGDHVNFAQRLEGEAARENEVTNKRNPSILISRTAFRCCRPWLTNYSELHLAPKGKGYEYLVYGIEPQDFNEALFITSETNHDWESAWTTDKEGSPLGTLPSLD